MEEAELSRRASFGATFAEFLAADPQSILGYLAQRQQGDVSAAQTQAWMRQISILRASVRAEWRGALFFELVIPRVGKRADVVLLVGNQIVVLEFKVGAATYDAAAKVQTIDYALDLKNFHVGSHGAVIAPVLCATEAPDASFEPGVPYGDVYPLALANARSLASILAEVASRAADACLDPRDWVNAGYRPTPTIVEASQALYQGHGVADITHSEAGADNLGATTDAMARIIDNARSQGHKVICFVSGVPGAGKTLAGLNLVCQRRKGSTSDEEHAVFLSGNGPLVRVLQEALARDDVSQAAMKGEKLSKADAHRKAVAFIQNIHHFRDESLKDESAPVERVVVFDEAQRAWNQEQTSKFMTQKRDRPGFDLSEPAFLIGVMDRHDGWAVITCLIGGGQEINTGEAGLEEWLRALRDRFTGWKICLPDQLESTDYLPTFQLEELSGRVTRYPELHLSVSLRSFRAERLSDAVGALMSADARAAAEALKGVLPRYPIVITRSLDDAKAWLRSRARGSERIGLLASSGGRRLKPLGICMELKIDPCNWFLNDALDVRSSCYLEDAASEFDVQGLELDWTAVVWDGDLIYRPEGWRARTFKGTSWQEVRDAEAQRYRQNAYRVLLTRARQGMVIVVPEGDDADRTRPREAYDPAWVYFQGIGLPKVRVQGKQ